VIGIVIVSHSKRLAEGVCEIADQMASHAVKIVDAGGIYDGGSFQLGTDPIRVLAAIEEAWSDDGVLILVDLGSAVLCAEMAVEMLRPERRTRCLVSNAPLVEGAIVAALQASLGQSLTQVNEAAEDALHVRKVENNE
jgi:phosphoenolpyruvate---glycerone phosphotransferase subunit DhaM